MDNNKIKRLRKVFLILVSKNIESECKVHKLINKKMKKGY